MKRIFLIFAWFSVTLTLFSANLAGVVVMRRKTPIQPLFLGSQSVTSPNVLGINDPASGITASIQKDDARIEILASFLERHNSPLEPYEQYAAALVEIADTYNIDYRLL